MDRYLRPGICIMFDLKDLSKIVTREIELEWEDEKAEKKSSQSNY